MLEFYPELRFIHIAAVLISGALFAARGLGLILGGRWPLSFPVKQMSYAVDTVLLTAALLLMTILQQYPFVHGWLTVKVLLLVLYIGLGIMAFRTNRGRGSRFGFWLAALTVYAFIISVARAHHPLGIFALLGT